MSEALRDTQTDEQTRTKDRRPKHNQTEGHRSRPTKYRDTVRQTDINADTVQDADSYRLAKYVDTLRRISLS